MTSCWSVGGLNSWFTILITPFWKGLALGPSGVHLRLNHHTLPTKVVAGEAPVVEIPPDVKEAVVKSSSRQVVDQFVVGGNYPSDVIDIFWGLPKPYNSGKRIITSHCLLFYSGTFCLKFTIRCYIL